MIDIGFSEIILIAEVAQLVVGPLEFPSQERNGGKWVGAIRRTVNSVKTEFEQEVHKADEIKRLMEREVEIAEAHKNTQPIHRAALASPGTAPQEAAGAAQVTAAPVAAPQTIIAGNVPSVAAPCRCCFPAAPCSMAASRLRII